jgi:hypothetical protein
LRISREAGAVKKAISALAAALSVAAAWMAPENTVKY